MATASSAPLPWWQARVAQWHAWPSPQKWRTLTLLGAVLAIGIVVIRTVDAPRWTPIYTQITPASAGAMSKVLHANQIPYTLANGGTTISVPNALVNQARVDLAEHNLPANNTATLPKAPTFSLGETDSEVSAVQQATLEDTLDTTISGMASITAANVLITVPPTTLFGESGTNPTASVFVTVAPNMALSRVQVTGIQHLVAAAVNGLTPTNVSVINQNGVWLSNPTAPAPSTSGTSTVTRHLAATNAVDQSMTTQVLHVLEPMFGPGNVVAHVQATLNFTATTTHTLQYTSRGTPTAQQIKTAKSTSTSTTTNAGAGTATNTPTYPTKTTTTTTPTTSQSSNRITHYDVGNTTRTVNNPGGTVTGLTVAVAINQPMKPATIRAVEALVRQTVGLPAKLQATNITVTAIPFNTHAATVADRTEAANARAAAAHQRTLEEYAGGAGVALLLLLGLWFRRRKPKLAKPNPSEPMDAFSPPMNRSEISEPDRPLDIARERLRQLADEHPDTVAKIVRSLAEGDE